MRLRRQTSQAQGSEPATSKGPAHFSGEGARLSSTHHVKCAIVGAGCAGLYSAWRLSSVQDPVVVFDTLGRIGGRLCSLEVPQAGLDLPVEVGGMRYTTEQVLLNLTVSCLAAHYDDLRPREFCYPARRFYLRGRHVVGDKLPEGIYGLDQHEPPSPVQLVEYAIRKALLDIRLDSPDTQTDKRVISRLQQLDWPQTTLTHQLLTDAEWAHFQAYARFTNPDCHLFEVGFWNLLQHYLSGEAYLLAHDGMGYESILANWNAAEAIPWFLRDFGTAKYLAPVGGMEAIPRAMAAEFLKTGGEIHYGHRLVRISIEETSGELELTFETEDRQPVVLTADKVILALPKGALERVEFQLPESFSAALDHWCNDLLPAVTAHPLLKIFLVFGRAWWRQQYGWNSGRSITDTPLRQIYYFGRLDGDPNRNALLMASYSDSHYVDFWRSLLWRDSADFFSRFEGNVEDDSGLADFVDFGVQERLVEKAIRQLERLHPEISQIPMPLCGFAKDWTEQPFYGGWHTWNPRQRPWDVADRIARPFESLNVFVCGEAYSRDQGWVEGALQTAEHVLVNYFGLAPLSLADPVCNDTDS